MLKQTEDETQPMPAANVRVTPEELSAALARLEARQEVSQQHQEGTVAIGDVVKELGLNTTPEQVLAEVQAERARQLKPLKKRLTFKERVLVFGAGAILLGLAGGSMMLHKTDAGGATVGTDSAISAAVNTSAIDTSNRPKALRLDPNLLVRGASGKLVRLSEVGNDQPVLCGVESLVTGRSTGTSFVPFMPYPFHWTLLKHGGKVYLRGWIADMSESALNSGTVNVYPLRADVPSGLQPVPVTLPVDGVLSMPGVTFDQMISASQVTTDTHLHEKW